MDRGHHLVGRSGCGTALRTEVEAVPRRVEARPGHLRTLVGRVGDPTKRCHLTLRTDDHQFHVATVLGDEQVAGALFYGDVVYPGEGLPAPTAVPYQLVLLVAKVDSMDPVVGFGSEPNPAVVVPDSLRARCHVCPGYLFLSWNGGACGIGYLPPGNGIFDNDHGL